MERRGQRLVFTGHGDAALLHGLQQRRLGARARPVDLVGHQKLTEHRPLDKAERTRSRLVLLQDLGAQNIGGHQVRGELHPLVVETQHRAQRLDQSRLAEAGKADQQRVTAGQQRDKCFVDYVCLAENYPANAVARHRHAMAERLDFRREARRCLRIRGGVRGEGVSFRHGRLD